MGPAPCGAASALFLAATGARLPWLDRLKSVLPVARFRAPLGFAGVNLLLCLQYCFPLQILAGLRIRRSFGRRVPGARAAADHEPGEAQHQEKPQHPDELAKLHGSFAPKCQFAIPALERTNQATDV